MCTEPLKLLTHNLDSPLLHLCVCMYGLLLWQQEGFFLLAGGNLWAVLGSGRLSHLPRPAGGYRSKLNSRS